MRKALLLVAGSCLLAVPALAGPDKDGRGMHRMGESMLERLDSDNSGTIEQAEVLEAQRERFDRLDLNDDGTITAEEMMEARRRIRAERRLERMDADGDGAVTEEDFTARAEQMFSRLDDDEDGSIAREEMRGRHTGKDDRHHGKGHRGKQHDKHHKDKGDGA